MSLGDRLLARVRAEPALLAHRQVYADWLTGVGDPRGEFITLQLAEREGGAQLSARARRRIRALIREHREAWLGPLAKVLTKTHTQFRAGFVSRGRVRRGVRALHVDAPQWATLEGLEGAPAQLALSPQLRALRELEIADRFVHAYLDGEPAHALRRLDIRFDRYRAGWVGPGRGLTARYRALLEEAPALAQLRALGLHFPFPVERERLAWLWSGQMAEGLELAHVGVEVDQYLALDEWVEGLRSDRGARLPTLVLGQAGFGYRRGRGALGSGARLWDRLTISGRGESAMLREGLGSLRECEVREIEVDPALGRQVPGRRPIG